MENNNSKHWLALINIPIQMGIIIFAGYKLGEWLDTNHPNPKIYYDKLITLFAVFVALYNVYRQVNEISKKQ